MERRALEAGAWPGILGHAPGGQPLVPERYGTAPQLAPPSLSVRGGPTSIHASLEELERGSALLAAAAAESTALAVRAAGWGSVMAIASRQSALAHVLASRTVELSSGLMAVGAEAEVLEHAVAFSAQSYRDAEARAQRAVQDVAGVPAVVLALGLVVADRPVPAALADLGIQGAPVAVAAVLNRLAPGLGGGFLFVADVAGRSARDEGRTGPMSGPELLYPLLTAAGAAIGVVQVGPVRVRAQGEATEPYATDGSLGAVMDHIDRARSADPGSIQVTSITPTAGAAGPGEDPGTVWMVSLPGTQSGDFADEDGWSTNPFDLSGNGEAMALDSQHVAAGVMDALIAAGAQPGDALVTTGYSQGGIHAARIAADPRLAEYFGQQGVVTVASPVAEIALDPEVEALHLEHFDDGVTGMDGRANPQGVNRTTVTFAGYAEGSGTEELDRGAAHGFGNYRAHVARLEDLSPADPQASGAAPARDQLALLTAGTAVTRTIALERTRPGEPRNPLGRLPAGPRGPGLRLAPGGAAHAEAPAHADAPARMGAPAQDGARVSRSLQVSPRSRG